MNDFSGIECTRQEALLIGWFLTPSRKSSKGKYQAWTNLTIETNRWNLNAPNHFVKPLASIWKLETYSNVTFPFIASSHVLWYWISIWFVFRWHSRLSVNLITPSFSAYMTVGDAIAQGMFYSNVASNTPISLRKSCNRTASHLTPCVAIYSASKVEVRNIGGSRLVQKIELLMKKKTNLMVDWKSYLSTAYELLL